MTEVSPGTGPASRPDHFPRPWPSRGITTLTALWGEAQDRRGRFIPAWRVVHDRLHAEGLGRTGTDLAEVWEHEWLSSLFGHATVSHEDPRQALADLRALAEACVAAQSTGAWARPTAGQPVFWGHCPSAKGVFCRLEPSEARQAEDTPHSARPRVALPYIEVFVAADRLLDPSRLTPSEAACVRAARYEMPGPDPEAHQRWRARLEARASAQIRGAIRGLALPLRVAVPPGMEAMELATLTDAAISFVLEADRRGVGSLTPSSDGTAGDDLSPVVNILPLKKCAVAGGIKSSSPAAPGTTTEEVEQPTIGPAAQGVAASSEAGTKPPGLAELPVWIAIQFKQQQQALLCALWGKGLVTDSELMRVLSMTGGTNPEENLKRVCSRVNCGLDEKSAGIEGRWSVCQVTYRGDKCRRLERLDSQGG